MYALYAVLNLITTFQFFFKKFETMYCETLILSKLKSVHHFTLDSLPMYDLNKYIQYSNFTFKIDL